ncbi:MAG: hypothetical protein ABI763_12325, partial [Bacteroidota bacterium]
GHPYKGDELDEYMPRMFYSWKKQKTSFSLVWSESQSIVVLFNQKHGNKKESTEEVDHSVESTDDNSE